MNNALIEEQIPTAKNPRFETYKGFEPELLPVKIPKSKTTFIDLFARKNINLINSDAIN